MGRVHIKSVDLPVIGQGLITFNTEQEHPLQIKVTVKDKRGQELKEYLCLNIDENKAEFCVYFDKSDREVLAITEEPDCGLEKEKMISYWLSYDRDRMVLKYGKGYYMEETTKLEYNFLEGAETPEEREEIRKKYWNFFVVQSDIKRVVTLFTFLPQHTKGAKLMKESYTDLEPLVEVANNPLVQNLPPVVLDSSKVSLSDLANNTHMFSGSLPPACQELYDNIKNCKLDAPDGPDKQDEVLLSNAIRHSIETKGCLLYEKLLEKKDEFGGNDENETYLRITLGQSFGNSPGIPYVLEIWPAGHCSLIHNHGASNAVIKVLFGSIHIEIFNKDESREDAQPLTKFDANRGAVTWVNNNWYQTHKLTNTTNDFCATIQCYSYDPKDHIHYPYFDYVKHDTYRNQFRPNTDFTFGEMRKKVLEEWKNRKPPLCN